MSDGPEGGGISGAEKIGIRGTVPWSVLLCVVVSLIFILAAGMLMGSIAADDPVDEPVLPIFEDFEDPEDWETYGDAAFLDVDGTKTLRLTDVAENEAGTGLYNNSFPSTLGITAELRYYADEGDGADGLSFFLLNASQVDPDAFSPGNSGGHLGYSGNPGISGGYLGVGFDEWGNFASSSEDGHSDGPSDEEVPQSVTVRGAGDEADGSGRWYPHLVTEQPSEDIDGGWRLARVTVDPTDEASDIELRVEMSFDEGESWETVIDDAFDESDTESPLPDEFLLGFSGSTGGSDNVHAIDSIDVQLPANLDVSVTDGSPATVVSGDEFEYTYEVENLGPNDAIVSVGNTLPVGSEGATDVSWSYKSESGSDSGFDLDELEFALADGETATVTVSGTVADEATGDLDHTLQATGESTLDPDVEAATADVDINILDMTDTPVCSEVEYSEQGGTYLIENLHQLQCIGDDANGPGLDKDYQLVDDIDASATDDWNDGKGFDPLGDSGTSFTGTFDGQGYEISNLTIDRPGETYVGLFGAAHSTSSSEEMIIQNLRLSDINVTGQAGSGTSNGGGVGGLLGAIDSTDNPADARVENTSVSGTVTADGGSYNAGGIVGGAVGVGGETGATLVDENVFIGTVDAKGVSQVGGIIGRTNWETDVSIGYVNATVTGGAQVGGLIGHSSSVQSTFEKMYFAGTVTGDDAGAVVGHIGDSGDTFRNDIYWDHDLENDGVGSGDGSFEAIGLSTSQMQGEAAEDNMDNLDFGDRWAPVTFPEDDYPVFEWQLIDENLELSEFAVEPTILDRGDEITATARLTNAGDTETVYNIPFEVDGTEIERAEGGLPAGSFVDLEFSHRVTATGEVAVTIGDHEPETITVGEELLEVNASNPTDGFDVDIELTVTGELDTFDVELENEDGTIVKTFEEDDFDSSSNDHYVYDSSHEVESSGSYTVTVTSATDTNGQGLTLDDDGADSVFVADGMEFFECETPTELVDHLVQDENIEVTAVDSTGNCNPAAAAFANLDLGSGNGVDFELPDGIHLSTYRGDVPFENTHPSWGGPNDGTRTSATERFYHDVEIGAEVSNPQNAMGIEFEFEAPDDVEAVEFEFMFGSEEYPHYVDSIVDGASVVVDGENYATFPDGTPLKVVSEADLHPNTGGHQFVNPHYATKHDEIELDIVYNGISEPQRISAPLDPDEDTHTVRITIADTMDQAFASGLFISAMAESDDTSGGIADIDPADAPSISTTDGTAEFVKDVDDPVTVDPGLTLEHEHDVTEAEVRISGGFVEGDALDVEDDQGLTIDSDQAAGVLTLNGEADAETYANALQTVRFTTDSDSDAQDREIQFRITGYETGNDEDPTVIPGSSRTVNVTLNPPPTAVATASESEAGIEDTIEFDASQSSDPIGIDSYEWDFGDANDAIGETATHSYSEDGEYEVVLTVEDQAGQTATDTLNITVIGGEFLIVSAGGNQTVDEGEQVSFDATDSEATVDIDQYSWKFGDGTEVDDLGALPTHTYTQPDEYQVSLTMETVDGITATTSAFVTVEDATPPEPVAWANETTPDLNQTVTFDAGNTTDNVDDTEALTFEWDLWGDGSIDATGETVEHTYDLPVSKSIPVELHATDTSGNSETDTLEIEIQNTESPEAAAGDDIEGYVGQELEFQGSDSRDNTGIDTYEWDFGDGTTATGERVTHRFEEPGEYEAELTVTNTVGLSDSTTVHATVISQPRLESGETAQTFEQHNGSVRVDPGLNLTTDDNLTGATVAIQDGFDTTTDNLDVQNGVANTYDVTADYDADRGILTLSGEANGAAYQEILRNVVYDHIDTHPDDTTREIHFALNHSDASRYNPDTGHHYQYVADEGITWEDARAAARDRSLYGLQGDLVTITSAEENAFIRDNFEDGGWIGATDEGEESVWRWVTGPEGLADDGAGRHFFDQTASHTGSHVHAPTYPGPPDGVPGGGEAIDGAYENWDNHEPNNKFPQFGGQHYAYFCAGTPGCGDGRWMDLDGEHNGEPTPAGYFVQFGGLPGEPDLALTSSQTVTVEPRDEPVANAGEDLDITDVDENQVEFSAVGSKADFDIVSYQWTFDHIGGGEETESGEVIEHSFTDDGDYVVTLTIEDDAGLTDSDTINVTVEDDAIIVANSGGNQTVADGDPVTFDGTGSAAVGGIDKHEWDFDDGNTTTGATPTHTYDSPGEYAVELTVRDDDNDNTLSTTSYVIVEDITPPEAIAQTVEEMPVGVGEDIQFDGSGSSDDFHDDADLTHEWDITNNGQFTETGQTITVSFDYVTDANATLRVTDPAGNENVTTVRYTVVNEEPPSVDAGLDKTGFAGETIAFDGSNSVAANGVAVESFEWDVTGDGEVDKTGSAVDHTFEDGDIGTNEVTLTVTDEFGNEASDTITVEVNGPPIIETSEHDPLFEEHVGPVAIDPELNVEFDDEFGGAVVSIDAGYDRTYDVLDLNTSIAAQYGIAHEFDPDRGVLELSGTADGAAYESVLQTVTYEHTGEDPESIDRTISVTLGDGQLPLEANGHFYEFVEAPQITWQEARDAAADRSHFGQQGYLATITSEEINEFVVGKLQGEGWIGASDAADEGVWRWVTGPEGEQDDGAGLHFFDQSASDDGTPVVTYGGDTPGGGEALEDDTGERYYENWDTNEPNDWGDGEDHAHYWASGTWNDYEYNNPQIDGYIVEYGGMASDPDGLQLTDTINVSVEPRDEPIADAGEDLNVTDIEDAEIEFNASGSTRDEAFEWVSFAWDFGDDTEALPSLENQTYTHTYVEDGNYTVELTVEDSANLTATDEIAVTVADEAVLVADAGVNQSADEGEEVTFDGSGSEAVIDDDAITSYQWNFGDGMTQSGEDLTEPTHTFTQPGVYEVELTVQDEHHNTATTRTYVHVADVTDPVADIAVSETEVAFDETVVYDASGSTDNVEIESYEWDLTSNGYFTETGETVTQTFDEINAEQHVTTTLRVTDTSGNVNETTKNVSVANLNDPIADAGGDFTAYAGEELQFDGTDSTDDVAIETFEWEFGDGNDTLGPTPTYTYPETGTYQVNLTVTDTAGNTDTASQLVTIQDRTPESFDATLEAADIDEGEATQIDITGEFSTTEAARSLGNPIHAADVTFESADPTIATVTQDGVVTGTGAGFTTLNASIGDKKVTLPIGVGLTDLPPTLSDLAVKNPDDRDVLISFESDQALDTIAVDVSGADPITLDEDNFTVSEVDGAYFYEATHAAAAGGPYAIEIVAALDDAGNDGVEEVDGDVLTGSVDTLDVHPRAGSFLASVGTEITLWSGNDTLVPDHHDDVEYRWDIGADGVYDATGQSVTHAFDSPGEIDVTLTIVTDVATATEMTTIEIEDRTPPVTNLEPVETVDNNTALTFDASDTTDNVGVVEFEWDFGDGTTETGGPAFDEPTHTYTAPGEYTVEVTARDAAGNERTNETTLVVLGPDARLAIADLEFGDTPINAHNTLSIPVHNDGTEALEIEAATTITGDTDQFAFVGSAEDLPVTVQPGQSVPIAVEYSPSEQAVHSGEVTIETNNTDATVSIVGQGVESDLSSDPSHVGFDDVSLGSTSTESVTIENEDSVAVDLASVEIVGKYAAQFSLESVPESIAGDGKEDVSIGFEPTSPGTATATLRIEDPAGETAATVPLSGVGIGPAATVTDDPIGYGEVGKETSTARTFDVRNDGNEPLEVTDVSLAGGDAEAFDIESTPTTLDSGESGEVQVGFTPREDREYEARVVVETTDPVTPSQNVTINGTGVGAEADVTPRTINFEDTQVGETAYAEIEVENLVTSLSELSVSRTEIVNDEMDEFDIHTGGAEFTLDPGHTRIINVSFEPTVEDERNAQLQILSDASNEPQITVWLSSTDTYVVVQEVATDEEAEDSTVNVDAKNLEAGVHLGVNVSQPGTRDRPVGFEELEMTVPDDDRFEINMTHSAAPVGNDAEVYTPGDGEDLLEYVRMNHSVTNPSVTFEDTEIQFRVDVESIPTDDPADLVLHRWDGNAEWDEMPLTVVGERGDDIIYRADTPGFSEFVITAAQEAEGESSPPTHHSGSDTDDDGEPDTEDDSETDDEESELPEDDDVPEHDDATETDETADDTGTADDSDPPTGVTEDEEAWVDPEDLPDLEIVHVDLQTEPANSVIATSIVTLENHAADTRAGTVRFILNGEVVDETDVTIAGGQQVSITHEELVTEPGVHTFEANVGTVTEDDELVRTFDFDIGVVEIAGDEPTLLGSLFWWLGGLFLLVLVVILLRRRDDEEEETISEME